MAAKIELNKTNTFDRVRLADILKLLRSKNIEFGIRAILKKIKHEPQYIYKSKAKAIHEIE